MKVVILVFDDCSLFAVSGMVSLLNNANQLYTGKPTDYFEVELLSTTSSKQVTCSFNMPVTCHSTMNDYTCVPDLVIVPGLESNIPKKLDQLKHVSQWIALMHAKGVRITGSCTGNFIIAQAGILDGKMATTHWKATELFKQCFPKVILCDEKILIDQGSIIMGGGTLSFQNMMMYLVEKQMGKDTAIALSKFMLLDMKKDPQSAYAAFNSQKNHTDVAILRAQNLIEDKPSSRWNIETLADQVAISVRHFNRRFKNATGQAPAEYIRRVKIETAKHFLESSQLTFEEIVQKVGYEDISSFRKQFTKLVGITPIQYRHKYN